jgi:hypothetical protein
MTAKAFIPMACALALVLAAAPAAKAQESGKTKDAALDSLLGDLKKDADDSAPKAKKAAKKAEPDPAKSGPSRAGVGPAQKSKESAGSNQGGAKPGSGAGESKPAPKAPKAGALAPKDQALDDLLGKLGESKDEPAPEDRPKNLGSGSGDVPKEPAGRAKEGAKLGGKDKDIDARLEELAGRKRKRPQGDDEQRSGPVGEMIKEMRDVEQRLGKPDPSEDTQAKQKQIIKRIDTLIEQVRQSGSSAGRLTIRRRQQGNQPGQQEGDQSGALARGAQPMKPAKPTSQHSTAGGKGVWGHLPEELRQVMDNSFKEEALTSKAELISRYFLSVGKGTPVREE